MIGFKKQTEVRRMVIDRLKARARRAYYRMNTNIDMSCGRNLADNIRGTDEVGAQKEFEALMRRLQRIDPTCPNSW